MTVQGVAQQLLLSEKTVRRAIRDGQLRATRFRSSWRIRREDADAWGSRSSGAAFDAERNAARSDVAVASAAALRAIERTR